MAWVARTFVVVIGVVPPVVVLVVDRGSRCSVAHLTDGVPCLDCLPDSLPLRTPVELRLSWVLWVTLLTGNCVLRATRTTDYEPRTRWITAWVGGSHE